MAKRMSTPPIHRGPLVRFPSTLRRVVVAVVVVVVGLIPACQQVPHSGGAGEAEAVLLGLYEFRFDDIGSNAMAASVRRLDDETGGLAPNQVRRASLGTEPVFDVTIANQTSAGFAVIDGATYLNQTVEITNRTGEAITGLTFIAYSGDWALDGTAFRIIDQGDPTTITPTVGTLPVADADTGDLILDENALQALSVVLYDETELGRL